MEILDLLMFPIVLGVQICRGRPKKEWIVSPPANIAAMPVGASTMKFLSISFEPFEET
jgi:hypothetical protein